MCVCFVSSYLGGRGSAVNLLHTRAGVGGRDEELQEHVEHTHPLEATAARAHLVLLLGLFQESVKVSHQLGRVI